MRLARAPGVVEAEEAQAVEAAVDEAQAVDAAAVGGILGERAFRILPTALGMTRKER
jgi:hypothetical protein